MAQPHREGLQNLRKASHRMLPDARTLAEAVTSSPVSERGSPAFLEQSGCIFIAAGPARSHVDGVGRPASEEQEPHRGLCRLCLPLFLGKHVHKVRAQLGGGRPGTQGRRAGPAGPTAHPPPPLGELPSLTFPGNNRTKPPPPRRAGEVEPPEESAGGHGSCGCQASPGPTSGLPQTHKGGRGDAVPSDPPCLVQPSQC